MKLQDVFKPVQSELRDMERELRSLAAGLSFDSIRAILERFFTAPGKYLRPALLLMSADAAGDFDAETRSRLVRAAAGVELIHNASLVHDDVIDEDLERRGQATVNAGHGNRVAILAGDTLYSKAFSMMIDALPKPLLKDIVDLNITMCSAEVEQEKNRTTKRSVGKELLLKINEGKTASFMSVACKIGASLGGGSPEVVARLEGFGLDFGMAFQLYDDLSDHDADLPDLDVLAEAQRFAKAALARLEGLRPSTGRTALRNLVEHLVDKGGN
ncbi:MAG TPA: polyprenyl synthetase family protein [Rectinemataceae bacterium]|nr:polyprenyl synthetase family protein [Rectinemataceae bacterium]